MHLGGGFAKLCMPLRRLCASFSTGARFEERHRCCCEMFPALKLLNSLLTQLLAGCDYEDDDDATTTATTTTHYYYYYYYSSSSSCSSSSSSSYYYYYYY